MNGYVGMDMQDEWQKLDYLRKYWYHKHPVTGMKWISEKRQEEIGGKRLGGKNLVWLGI